MENNKNLDIYNIIYDYLQFFVERYFILHPWVYNIFLMTKTVRVLIKLFQLLLIFFPFKLNLIIASYCTNNCYFLPVGCY